MDKQNVQTYNGLWFSLRKESDSDTGYIMDELDILLSETGQSHKDKHCVIPQT